MGHNHFSLVNKEPSPRVLCTINMLELEHINVPYAYKSANNATKVHVMEKRNNIFRDL